MSRVEISIWLLVMVTVLVTAPIGSSTDPDVKQLLHRLQRLEKLNGQLQAENRNTQAENRELQAENRKIQAENRDIQSTNVIIQNECKEVKDEFNEMKERFEKIEQRTIETMKVALDDSQEVEINEDGIGIQNNYVPSNVYTRWGRTVCGVGVDRVYSGVTGKGYAGHAGGGVNQQCLPHNPQYANYVDGDQHSSPGRGLIYGAEYQGDPDSVFDQTNLDGSTFVDNDIPCAVCRVENQTSILMIPAQTECPIGWNQLYWGYLMSEFFSDPGASEFICVDNAPEVVNGGSAASSASYMQLVEVHCGHSLPCPNYIDGWELTCVVCTR